MQRGAECNGSEDAAAARVLVVRGVVLVDDVVDHPGALRDRRHVRHQQLSRAGSEDGIQMRDPSAGSECRICSSAGSEGGIRGRDLFEGGI